MTSRGSAVERSTLEALKFAVPKSLEDIFVVVMVEEESFWLSLERVEYVDDGKERENEEDEKEDEMAEEEDYGGADS